MPKTITFKKLAAGAMQITLGQDVRAGEPLFMCPGDMADQPVSGGQEWTFLLNQANPNNSTAKRIEKDNPR